MKGGERLCTDYKLPGLRLNRFTLSGHKGQRGICQKDDHFKRDSLKAIEGKAFLHGPSLRERKLITGVCRSLMYSRASIGNSAAACTAKLLRE